MANPLASRRAHGSIVSPFGPGYVEQVLRVVVTVCELVGVGTLIADVRELVLSEGRLEVFELGDLDEDDLAALVVRDDDVGAGLVDDVDRLEVCDADVV